MVSNRFLGGFLSPFSLLEGGHDYALQFMQCRVGLFQLDQLSLLLSEVQRFIVGDDDGASDTEHRVVQPIRHHAAQTGIVQWHVVFFGDGQQIPVMGGR